MKLLFCGDIFSNFECETSFFYGPKALQQHNEWGYLMFPELERNKQ
jgi:hypothetical protein